MTFLEWCLQRRDCPAELPPWLESLDDASPQRMLDQCDVGPWLVWILMHSPNDKHRAVAWQVAREATHRAITGHTARACELAGLLADAGALRAVEPIVDERHGILAQWATMSARWAAKSLAEACEGKALWARDQAWAWEAKIASFDSGQVTSIHRDISTRMAKELQGSAVALTADSKKAHRARMAADAACRALSAVSPFDAAQLSVESALWTDESLGWAKAQRRIAEAEEAANKASAAAAAKRMVTNSLQAHVLVARAVMPYLGQTGETLAAEWQRETDRAAQIALRAQLEAEDASAALTAAQDAAASIAHSSHEAIAQADRCVVLLGGKLEICL